MWHSHKFLSLRRRDPTVLLWKKTWNFDFFDEEFFSQFVILEEKYIYKQAWPEWGRKEGGDSPGRIFFGSGFFIIRYIFTLADIFIGSLSKKRWIWKKVREKWHFFLFLFPVPDFLSTGVLQLLNGSSYNIWTYLKSFESIVFGKGEEAQKYATKCFVMGFHLKVSNPLNPFFEFDFSLWGGDEEGWNYPFG